MLTFAKASTHLCDNINNWLVANLLISNGNYDWHSMWIQSSLSCWLSVPQADLSSIMGGMSVWIEEQDYFCPSSGSKPGRWSGGLPSPTDIFRGGEHDEGRRWAAKLCSCCCRELETKPYNLCYWLTVRKYAQERIAPLVPMMDENSVMDEEVITSMFEQGVCTLHLNIFQNSIHFLTQ